MALARACWSHGADLTDIGVIGEVMRSEGLDSQDLERRLGAAGTKRRLIDRTEEALQAGVFGVPTFEIDGELFWGHDRLEHLAARLHDRIPDPEIDLRELLDRPTGAVRRGAPGSSD